MSKIDKRKKLLAICSFCFVFFAIFFSIHNGYAEATVNTAEISDGFWKMYLLIRNTAMFVGALSIAFCGYHMLTGNSSDFEKYKKIAILSALAIGLLWALPTVVAIAKNIARNNAWQPDHPGL